MRPVPTRTWRAVAFVCGAVAAVLNANFLLVGPLQVPDVAFVSELGIATHPYSSVFRAGDLISGLLLLVMLPVLVAVLPGSGYRRAAGRVAVWCLAAFGLGQAVSAAVPLSCVKGVDPGCRATLLGGLVTSWPDRIHATASTVSVLGILAAAILGWAAMAERGHPWLRASMGSAGAVALTVGTWAVVTTALSWSAGQEAAQRIQIVAISGVVLVFALACLVLAPGGPPALNADGPPGH